MVASLASALSRAVAVGDHVAARVVHEAIGRLLGLYRPSTPLPDMIEAAPMLSICFRSTAPSLRRTALALAAALILAGCSSGGDSGGNSPAPADPVPLTAFCAEWSAARCAGVQRCCTQTTGKYADDAACAAGETALCEATMLPALGNPQFIYDEQAGGDLIARLRRSGDGCREPDGALEITGLLKPALEPGSACDLAGAAALGGNPCKGTICKPASAESTAGTCLVLPAEGELCPDLFCAAGLVCTSETDGDRCRPAPPLPAEGSSCDGSSDDLCAPGLRCMPTTAALRAYFSGGDYPEEHTCQPLHKNGEQALDPGDCESGLMKITSQASLAATCTACRSHQDCYSQNTDAFDGLVSVDNYSGYCDQGVCHDGLNDVAPGSKSEGAICFDVAECRSLSCDRTPGAYGHCQEANVEALFCTTPFTGGGAATDGGTALTSSSSGSRPAARP